MIAHSMPYATNARAPLFIRALLPAAHCGPTAASRRPLGVSGYTGGVAAAATRTVSRSAVRTPGFRRSRHVRTSAAWSS